MRTRRLACSGLPYRIHCKASQRKAAPIVLPGVPLGLFDNIHYDQAAIPLELGDGFVFHSSAPQRPGTGRKSAGRPAPRRWSPSTPTSRLEILGVRSRGRCAAGISPTTM